MEQPFIQRAPGGIPPVVPRKADLETWIANLDKAIKKANRERPQTEGGRHKHSESLKKMKIIKAEFEALKEIIN